jgi:hypothetical protein
MSNAEMLRESVIVGKTGFGPAGQRDYGANTIIEIRI